MAPSIGPSTLSPDMVREGGDLQSTTKNHFEGNGTARGGREASRRRSQNIAPFDLIAGIESADVLRTEAAALCGVESSRVEDIYPCSPFTEGVVAAGLIRPGAYIIQFSLALQANVDRDTFIQAWRLVFESSPILRTRIVSLRSRLVQIVLKEEFPFHLTETSKPLNSDYPREGTSLATKLGGRLTDFALVHDEGTGLDHFHWTVHHAIYDGFSLSLVMGDVALAYRTMKLEKRPTFNSFIRYLQDHENSATQEYWKSQFRGLENEHFPRALPESQRPVPDKVITKTCPIVVKGAKNSWLAACLRAGWSLVLSSWTSSADVVFGAVVSGRTKAVEKIWEINGPTLAIVPVRILLDKSKTISLFIEEIQEQAQQMKPYEHVGLPRIANMGYEMRRACEFQTVLTVHPTDYTRIDDGLLGTWEKVTPQTLFYSHAISIDCIIQSEGVKIRATFDSSIIETWKMERILAQFSFIVDQLFNAWPGQTIQEINIMTEQDLEDIWGWNATTQGPAVEACVPELIAEMAQKQQDTIAICASDGTISYGELDMLSTRLALQLIDIGVSPGAIVPLCFDKSMWTPVAILGVLKAGAAFCPLDAQTPSARLLDIVARTGCSVVVAGEGILKNISDELGRTLVLPLELTDISTHTHTLPALPLNSMAYIIFTSGSTGRPKGVEVDHSALSISILAHGKFMGYEKNTRMLHFSSIAFDATIAEILTTLVFGGCVCIPSQAQRDHDIASYIRDKDVNMAFSTPSVLNTFSPAEVPKLRTVVCGGEVVTGELMQQWCSKLNFIHAYGPTETIIYSLASYISSNDCSKPSIGRSLHGATWIVDVAGNSLVGIGMTGELLIESPALARGYFDEAEMTAAAFLEDPSWLIRGTKGVLGRPGRLYKTGDLVRYQEDGKLEFVGRKDGQVKIRGQRVELDEVELHVRHQLQQSARRQRQKRGGYERGEEEGKRDVQVVAEVVKPTASERPMLVAFICLDEADNASRNGEMQQEREYELRMHVAGLTAGLDERLAAILPAYMLPAAYVGLAEIPMTSTGKTDRRRLREMASTWTLEELAGAAASQGGGVDVIAPTNSTEVALRDIWANVLHVSAASISIDVAFLRLGGDSITAMQVAARCRAQNIHIEARDILRLRTIREIAQQCRPVHVFGLDTAVSPDSNMEVEEVEAEREGWTLSPIQKLFFDAHPGGHNHFNQSFMLKMRKAVTMESMRAAVLAITGRHAMLRARFRRNGQGEWEQYVPDNHSSATLVTEHVIHHIDEAESLAQSRQRALDIQSGPVFAVDIFTVAGEEQVLLLSAHHLIIDLVSWRLIWHDMQEHLCGRALTRPTTSFRKWCKLQRQRSEGLPSDKVLPFVPLAPDLEYWDVGHGRNEARRYKRFSDRLDSAATSLLLGRSNVAFSTEPLDILLAILVRTFRMIFPERRAPAIFLEGHGREPIEGLEIDVSETVGWFTTLHPLQLPDTASEDFRDAIRIAKDIRRKVPEKGRAYFARQGYGEFVREELVRPGQIEVMLNYSGQFQQLEHDAALFFPLSQAGTTVRLDQLSPDVQRFGLVEVNVRVVEGQMEISVDVNTGMKHQTRLEKWPALFADELRVSARKLAESPNRRTLSDFPLLSISYTGLDTLMEKQLNNRDDVRDIYPCTPLQSGILLSQRRGLASYANHWIWNCKSTGGAVSPERLEQAWMAMVARHSIFSTVFVDNVETGGFVQVVLNAAKPNITRLHSDAATPEEALSALKEPSFEHLQPEYAITICRVKSGEVAFRLDINHALIDAASLPVLVRDLTKVYSGMSLAPAPQFREAMDHITRIPRADSLKYWKQFLGGVEPCCLPVEFTSKAALPKTCDDGTAQVRAANTRGIYDFCKSKSITRATFLQVTWALMLSRYTTTRSACFGYLASGRDLPIDNVDEIVGPLINMLVCRVDLDVGVDEVLAATSTHLVQHFGYQHTSLAEIQHELGLGGRRLFNTAVTVRNNHSLEDSLEGLSLRLVDSSDPNEYDVVLSAKMHGPEMDLALSYRKDSISALGALEIGRTLEWAIEYILQKETASTNDVGLSLCQDFFKYQIGASEEKTANYWQKQLAGAEGVEFPELPSATYRPRADKVVRAELAWVESASNAFTMATAVRTAWAVLQTLYTDADEAVFGATVQAPTRTVEHVARPTILTVPVRVIVDQEVTVGALLRRVQDQLTEMIPYERAGLHWIMGVSDEAQRCCGFQTLLVVQPVQLEDDEALNTFNTHAMIIEILANMQDTHMQITFDSQVVDEPRIRRIISQFEHILRQVCTAENAERRISEVTWISERDLRKIWGWNSMVPAPVEACVHELITETAESQLQAPAVCAWDGELTYRELETLSTELAYQLVKLGVADTIVPLCFEKSMWMPVAMLGVMKSGAASVALDITQPEERLHAIVSQVSPIVLLSSTGGHELASRLSKSPIVCVDSVRRHTQCSLPRVTPDQRLYIVFTSGSTGVPKGAVITHRNFSSALQLQRASRSIRQTSRVLDFASYAFDMAWYNALHTFHAGGCLCIPSETERRQSLGLAITRFRANFANLTPTVADTLDKASLRALETLELAGESIKHETFVRLSALTNVSNAYGPAESSAIVVRATKMRNEHDIGVGVGVRTWVVRTEDGTGLCPIGCIGELWIEGPLVGQGYLQDTKKTAAAFVEDPDWLVRKDSGVPGVQDVPPRVGRLYRTGDLVRYREEDGGLEFVGRKDRQVKVRGQRVELEEVEHWVRQLLSVGEGIEGEKEEEEKRRQQVQIVAEVVTPQDTKRPMLAVFIVSNQAGDMTKKEQDAVITDLTRGIDDRLAEVLPAYMWPSAYVSIPQMPMTATGKKDRRKLRDIGASIRLHSQTTADDLVVPANQIESTLRDIWAAVLNLPSASISVEARFGRIGGDSITAMQVVSRCRQNGILLTVGDMLELQTIRKVSVRCKHKAHADQTEQVLVDVRDNDSDMNPWSLSPIQQMFFDRHPDGVDHFNQSFLLELRKPVAVGNLEKAVQAIVHRHSMLRACFCAKSDGQWQQSVHVVPDPADASIFAEHIVTGRDEVATVAQGRQRSFNIREGRVFAVDLFCTPDGGQAVLMSAHHLVVDLVSWRVIWHDLREYLEGHTPGPKPVSFEAWTKLLQNDGRTLTPAHVLPLSIKPPQYEFWEMTADQNTVGQSEVIREMVTPEATALLLGKSNHAYGSEVVEILLAAITYAFQKIFPERATPTIFVEGHGRDALAEEEVAMNVDASETVGWFTTLSPISVPENVSDSPTDLVRIIKDIRRRTPGKGGAYLACRYYNVEGRAAFGADLDFEVLLNYAGMFQQLESAGSLLSYPRRPEFDGIDLKMNSPAVRRMALIETHVTVERERMTLHISISNRMKYQERLRQWAKMFAETLGAMSRMLADMPSEESAGQA